MRQLAPSARLPFGPRAASTYDGLPQDWTVYEVPTNGFNVSLPQTWSRLPDKEDEALLFFATGGAADPTSMSVGNHNPLGSALDELIAANVKDVENNPDVIRPVSHVTVNLSGLQSGLVQFCRRVTKDGKSQSLAISQYLLPEGSNLYYVITFVMPPETAARHSDTNQRIAASLKLSSPRDWSSFHLRAMVDPNWKTVDMSPDQVDASLTALVQRYPQFERFAPGIRALAKGQGAFFPIFAFDPARFDGPVGTNLHVQVFDPGEQANLDATTSTYISRSLNGAGVEKPVTPIHTRLRAGDAVALKYNETLGGIAIANREFFLIRSVKGHGYAYQLTFQTSADHAAEYDSLILRFLDSFHFID